MRLKKPTPAAAPAPTTEGESTGSTPAPGTSVAEGESTASEAADSPATTAAAPSSAGGSISLLGVAGAALKSTEERRGGRKRTPGEIRIQKGTQNSLQNHLLTSHILLDYFFSHVKQISLSWMQEMPPRLIFPTPTI